MKLVLNDKSEFSVTEVNSVKQFNENYIEVLFKVSARANIIKLLNDIKNKCTEENLSYCELVPDKNTEDIPVTSYSLKGLHKLSFNASNESFKLAGYFTI